MGKRGRRHKNIAPKGIKNFPIFAIEKLLNNVGYLSLFCVLTKKGSKVMLEK